MHDSPLPPSTVTATESGVSCTLVVVDDNPANVAAAGARGWQTHLFEGPEGLEAELERRWLLG